VSPSVIAEGDAGRREAGVSALAGEGAAAAATVDGRRQRAERSRAAVVDALLSLYDDGVVHPGVADIAARAGVSARSVFRHFDDLEALARVAIDRQWQRVGHLFAAPAADADDIHARVAALVDQRLRLHAAVIGVARAAAALAASSPLVASTLRARRRLLADQVTAQLAPELRRRRGRARDELAAALAAAASLENVDYLRTHGGLEPDRAAAVVRRTLLALLDVDVA
jgi:TetR/AcrR family transcriptional regulator, regulator of autoinduction and epiphytic fitness